MQMNQESDDERAAREYLEAIKARAAIERVLAERLMLCAAEIEALTGYKRPAKQLTELHRQGFFRARMSHLGGVLLERAHYDAVCRGVIERERPKLNLPIVKPPRARR